MVSVPIPNTVIDKVMGIAEGNECIVGGIAKKDRGKYQPKQKKEVIFNFDCGLLSVFHRL
jgi:hypothetical protein